MALSLLYLAFVRILQFLRLVRHDNEELAVEVKGTKVSITSLDPGGKLSCCCDEANPS
jgi:hypothetical protein